jgi:C-methyltransferase C-terminal domain
MRLVDENQYDTIYHEHFSYFSFSAVRRVFAAHELRVFDVEELPTHGGSLRIYACHAGDERGETEAARELLEREERAGYGELALYLDYAERVRASKRDTLDLLISLKREGATIAGYGAAAKGNTLLNFCGIRTDLLDYTVDRNPYKQGQCLPGTHIPIKHPEVLESDRPDYILILPWNLKQEIVQQLAHAREWGARFVVPIPEVEVL